MIVFYNPADGAVTWTMMGDRDPVAAAGPWIKVPDQNFATLTGLRVVNGALTWADPAGVREVAYNALFALLDEAEQSVTNRVTVGEKSSWTLKEIAARAWLAGTATAEQQMMLAVEANYTGENLTALANVVVARADQYLLLAPAIAGIRRKYEAQIAAATSGFDAILHSAGQDLLAMLTQ